MGRLLEKTRYLAIFGALTLLVAALGVLYCAVTQPGRILHGKTPPGEEAGREGPPDPG